MGDNLKKRIGLALPRSTEALTRLVRTLGSDPAFSDRTALVDLTYHGSRELRDRLKGAADLDGLLIWAPDAVLHAHAAKHDGQVPMVGLLHPIDKAVMAGASIDLKAAVAVLVEHMAAPAMASWAYLGLNDVGASQQVAQLLAQRLRSSGQPLQTCQVPSLAWMDGEVKPDLEGVATWLKSLDKPAAVICFSPRWAKELVVQSQGLGLSIPGDVCIASLHDEPICLMCDPTVTAVNYPLEEIGRTALRRALAVASGRSGGSKPAVEVVPGAELSVRGSTGPVDMDQQAIDHATRYIQNHACRLASVDELMDRTQYMSRSKFFKLFHDRTGMSPYAMIRQIRMEHGRRLLLESAMSVGQIAVTCGYADLRHFSTAFRREFGMPPSAYRKTRGQGPDPNGDGLIS